MENCFPEPRAFQATAHERLRDGVRNGHRCQILMAATGAGKTYLGLRIIHEALERERRAIFVCDRTTLIHQGLQPLLHQVLFLKNQRKSRLCINDLPTRLLRSGASKVANCAPGGPGLQLSRPNRIFFNQHPRRRKPQCSSPKTPWR